MAEDGSAGFVPFALPDIGDDEVAAVVDTLRGGWLTTGAGAAAFEREFAQAFGAGAQAIAVTSATAGLHLALEGLGIGPGDEVLVPTWTFTATAEVVRYLGAEPVLVDVAADTLQLDLADAAARTTARTRAVIPVHFAGLVHPPAALAAFARSYGLSVVEDAAHAVPGPAAAAGLTTGMTAATVFSFYATKTMTTGEGGMLVTADPDLARRARTMRLHGISRDVFDRYRSTEPAWHYEVVAPGYKYNLTDVAAALGRVQLRRCAGMRDRRAAIAARYDAAFAELPVDRPPSGCDADGHAWHLYVLRLRPEAPLNRNAFIEEMARLGVGCSVHFIPLHLHPYWRSRPSTIGASFPVATAEYERVVSLPIFSAMTDEQVERVVGAVGQVLG